MSKIKLMIEVDEGQEYENLKRGIGMADTLRNAKCIEECDDAISRQTVDEIKELMTDINGDTVYAVRMSDIRQLSSVKPQNDVLDKISAEILNKAYWSFFDERINDYTDEVIDLDDALEIIDKYRGKQNE